MARKPRLDLPGIPQHIVQRGNNRLPCFLDDIDRGEALLATGCKLHTNVLMDNHVHLLATPPEVDAAGRVMQQLGRRYVGQFDARHTRTGTLWEGRYTACLVDSEEYLPRCSRHIDLNPVRARMTDDPVAFPWSSCTRLCGLRDDLLLKRAPRPACARCSPLPHPARRGDQRPRPGRDPYLTAAATRLRPRRLSCDGRSQNPALRQPAAGTSAGQVKERDRINEPGPILVDPVRSPREPVPAKSMFAKRVSCQRTIRRRCQREAVVCRRWRVAQTLGVVPKVDLNWRLRWLWSAKPVLAATRANDRPCSISFLAFCSRFSVM